MTAIIITLIWFVDESPEMIPLWPAFFFIILFRVPGNLYDATRVTSKSAAGCTTRRTRSWQHSKDSEQRNARLTATGATASPRTTRLETRSSSVSGAAAPSHDRRGNSSRPCVTTRSEMSFQRMPMTEAERAELVSVIDKEG